MVIMKPHAECGTCLFHWIFERTVPYTKTSEVILLTRKILNIIVRHLLPTTNIGSLCNKTVQEVFKICPDLKGHYETLKKRSNEHAKDMISEATFFINSGVTVQERIKRASYLASAANVAPLNAPSAPYTFEEIRGIIGEGMIETETGDGLFEAIKKSSDLLYITDNAGEIGFDMLLIKEIKAMGKGVTLVVKKETFFEDATFDDLPIFGLDQLVDYIITVPGFMVTEELEQQTLSVFNAADLIIAKGTGSYEALHGETEKKTAYMLKVKCTPIARELNVPIGTIIAKIG